MRGAFTITCRRRDDGITAIATQAVSSPWHLSKPYWDGQVLLVQAANATAGVFAGDELTLDVTVARDASVLLTSPSAHRIYTMPQGEASQHQCIRVEAGAWLEWMPELFIPQRDCRYRQETVIDLADTAGLYFVETMAPGRVGGGEQFAFRRLDWDTRIRRRERLVWSERFTLEPDGDSLRDLTRNDAAWYVGNALLVRHDIEAHFRTWQHEVNEWSRADVLAGATRLDDHVYLFRVMACGSELLREHLRRLRDMLAGSIAPLRQSARKL